MSQSFNDDENWDLEIKPISSLWELNLKEVWKYKYLLFLFVKRDIVTVYQQTILGPTWFFIQPILTSLTYLIVFGKIANMSTGDTPKLLFYLSGVAIWNYFTTCLNGTATTFTANAGIFGKIYFPRLVIPVSVIVSNSIKFFIQLIPLILFYIYFVSNGATVRPNIYMLLIPILLIMAGLLGLGIGIIVSSLTTKYRDLSFVLGVVVSLLMYASTVIYPLEAVKNKLLLTIIKLNPLTWTINAFRYCWFSTGEISWYGLAYSFGATVIFLMAGILIFNKTQKTFIDTV
jgi:lipopolysaccharide transport system permease protein